MFTCVGESFELFARFMFMFTFTFTFAYPMAFSLLCFVELFFFPSIYVFSIEDYDQFWVILLIKYYVSVFYLTRSLIIELLSHTRCALRKKKLVTSSIHFQIEMLVIENGWTGSSAASISFFNNQFVHTVPFQTLVSSTISLFFSFFLHIRTFSVFIHSFIWYADNNIQLKTTWQVNA